MPARIVMFAASPLLVAPDLTTDIIGICGVIAVFGYQLWRNRTAPAKAAVAARE
jgi:hypothetical protein